MRYRKNVKKSLHRYLNRKILEKITAELQKKFLEVRLAGIEELGPHEF
jgi:hypothetical protein